MLFLSPQRRKFLGAAPARPPAQYVVFPPECVFVTNVVTQTRFNQRVSGVEIMKRYPFCRRNSKNWRAVLIRSVNPSGAASVYDNAMMMITGCTSARASRYAADKYVEFLQKAGYPTLAVVDFKVINVTATFALPGALDKEKYEREVDSSLVYIPDSFVGARKRCRRTNALLTLFTKNGTALGSLDLRNICFDVHDELKRMRPCLCPFGSHDEAELLKREIVSRKRSA
jgi:TATA-box binding protein (TBP) (component of TFIID and TFIIIB)